MFVIQNKASSHSYCNLTIWRLFSLNGEILQEYPKTEVNETSRHRCWCRAVYMYILHILYNILHKQNTCSYHKTSLTIVIYHLDWNDFGAFCQYSNVNHYVCMKGILVKFNIAIPELKIKCPSLNIIRRNWNNAMV